MKFCEAIEKAKPGDKLKRRGFTAPWFEIHQAGGSIKEVKSLAKYGSLFAHHYTAEDWEIIPVKPEEPKPKTRDEMKMFLSDTFSGWPFMSEDMIESMVDIFDACQWKATAKRPAFCEKEKPKVLTADQIRTKVRAEDPTNTKSVGMVMYDCAGYGIENGRMEMWLEFKKYYDLTGPGTIAVFFNALENLKPLKAE